MARRTPVTRAFVTFALAAFLSAPLACRPRSDRCSDPVRVAQAFVRSLEVGDREGALAVLSAAARETLDQAARDASTRVGHEVRPADLLVPERSVLVDAERLELRSVDGDEAFVERRSDGDAGAAAGDARNAQRLVREDGCWRVDLFYPTAGGP